MIKFFSSLNNGATYEEITGDIAVPSKMYLLNGVQNDFFTKSFLKRWYDFFYVRFGGTVTYLRNFQSLASVVNVSNGQTMKFDLIEKETFTTTKSVTSTIAAGDPALSNGAVNVSIIGDSLTNDGAFFKNALITNGYVPDINLIGMRKITNESQYDEGRGGWTLDMYLREGKDVTSGYSPFMHPNGKRYWGSTQFWIDAWSVVDGTDGGGFEPRYSAGRYDDYVGIFNKTTGLKVTPNTGDVMYDTSNSTYIEWNGSSWVNNDGSSYTWNFNYTTYLSMWGITSPDYLCVMLGTNDFRDVNLGYDFSDWNTKMEGVISSYKSAVPTGKFAILIPPSVTGNLNTTSNDDTEKQHAVLWEARKNIIDTFDNRDNESIYVVDVGITVSAEYGFNEEDSSLNVPYTGYSGTKKIEITNNSPHPYSSYSIMGIPVAAFLQNKR